MSEQPHYRVEHPQMSGLQDYINRAYESGWEVVSLSPVDSSTSIATLVLKPAEKPKEEGDRLYHLLCWLRLLPKEVDEPAGMVKLVRHLLADMDTAAGWLHEDRVTPEEDMHKDAMEREYWSPKRKRV